MSLKNPLKKYKTPIIFNKKKNKENLKKYLYIDSDTGKMKHYPPAAQEWYNSIYTFNKNKIKLLPALDKNLLNLFKSYSNMHLKDKQILTKRKTKRRIKYNRLSPIKVFVGRGNVKHTNNKAIITLFIYNTEKLYLNRIYKDQYFNLFLSKIKLKKQILLDKDGKEIIKYNRPFTYKEFITVPGHYDIYFSHVSLLINKVNFFFRVIVQYLCHLSKLVHLNVINEQEKLLIFKNKANFFYALKYPDLKEFLNKAIKIYISKYLKFRYLLRINKAKFEWPFLQYLKGFVTNMYKKRVEFNVVSLNKMHLNSDIFTQIVTSKLKNRNNRLFRVLRSSLSKVKLPIFSRISEKKIKPNKKDFLINKIRNTYINSMLEDKTINVNNLNELLLKFFPSADKLEIVKNTRISSVKWSVSLKNYVLKTLKHNKLFGVRVEAKGRLTRRFTASRSVYKMRYKGGLKNVESSFGGLSAVILRGNIQSNVQYSFLSGSNRIGAFGVKGWVSSK